MGAAGIARAHPFLINSWQVVAGEGRLTMRATATLREVMVIQGLTQGQLTNLTVLQHSVSNHASYVASNLIVEVAGVAVPLEVLDHQLLLEETAEAEDSERYPDLTHVAYDLEALIPAPASGQEIRLRHTTLRGHSYAPGIAWEPSYILNAMDRERRSLGQDVLRAGGVVALRLPGQDPAARVPGTAGATNPAPATLASAPVDAPVRMAFAGFIRHGIHHVATGYDHLLFLAALALACRSFGRLLGIIGVFTLAHSITVTLASIGWVRVPSSIVEPVIAGSIVWVALENVLAPSRSAGGGRLAVAFGFGLVHGLGFAGGLREVLENMPGVSLVGGVVGFCLGVELGHLAVGAPLFGILRVLRRSPATLEQPGTPAPTIVTPLVRWGSIGVALGGAWFLWAALRSI